MGSKCYIFLLLIAGILTQLNTLYAQQKLMLHPLVGEQLEQEEIQRYGLLQEYKANKILIAEFYATAGEEIEMRLEYKGKENDVFLINSAEFGDMQARIEEKGRVFLLMINLIGERLSDGEEVLVAVSLWEDKEITGEVLAVSNESILLAVSAGELRLGLDKIEGIEFTDKVRRSQSEYFSYPLPSRYFTAPSAIPLKKGEGFYQNTMLFVNSAQVGITDNLSIGGGFELISLFSGTPLFAVGAKLAFPVSKKLHLGVGAVALVLVGFGPATRRTPFVAEMYGVATYGESERNITFGLGWGTDGRSIAARPTIILGGVYRLRRRVSVMADFYIFPVPGEDIYVVSGTLGPRIMFSRKFILDLGITLVGGIPDLPIPVIAGPYAAFIYSFGK